MKGNRCPVAVPFLWGKEGLVWVGGWLPSLSVGPTVACQPLHGLEVHLQLGKSEVKYFKVFVPTIPSGQSVGDMALAHRGGSRRRRGGGNPVPWLRIPSEPS